MRVPIHSTWAGNDGNATSGTERQNKERRFGRGYNGAVSEESVAGYRYLTSLAQGNMQVRGRA